MLADKESLEYISTGKVDQPLRSFCITNPTVFDNPIVYASPDFTELTGYDTQSIVGYNCRFLQGAGSDPNEIYRLKMAIEQGQRTSAVIKNYRRDGSPFWNRIKIAPMVDSYSKVVLIVGIHTEVYQLFTAAGEEMFTTVRPDISEEAAAAALQAINGGQLMIPAGAQYASSAAAAASYPDPMDPMSQAMYHQHPSYDAYALQDQQQQQQQQLQMLEQSQMSNGLGPGPGSGLVPMPMGMVVVTSVGQQQQSDPEGLMIGGAIGATGYSEVMGYPPQIP